MLFVLLRKSNLKMMIWSVMHSIGMTCNWYKSNFIGLPATICEQYFNNLYWKCDVHLSVQIRFSVKNIIEVLFTDGSSVPNKVWLSLVSALEKIARKYEINSFKKLPSLDQDCDSTRGNSLHCTAKNSHSQIFRYGRSIFCLPHRPKFSDFFDLCFHWVSVVRAHW